MVSSMEGKVLTRFHFFDGAFCRRQSVSVLFVQMLLFIIDSGRNTLIYSNAITDIAAAAYIHIVQTHKFKLPFSTIHKPTNSNYFSEQIRAYSVYTCKWRGEGVRDSSTWNVAEVERRRAEKFPKTKEDEANPEIIPNTAALLPSGTLSACKNIKRNVNWFSLLRSILRLSL